MSEKIKIAVNGAGGRMGAIAEKDDEQPAQHDEQRGAGRMGDL